MAPVDNEWVAKRCDAHIADDGGRCTRAAGALFAVSWGYGEAREWLCGTHVACYRRAGARVRFLRTDRY